MYSRKRRRLLSPKERKEERFRIVISQFNFWFEEAVSPRLDDLSKEIRVLREKIQEIEHQIRDYEENNTQDDENGRPSEAYLDLFSEIGGLDAESHLFSEQLLSIEEMKLVFLYKEFEIMMKELIPLSFPDAAVDELFKWDYIKSFFKGYGILIGDIRKQNLVNELRLVNNNIKHSNIIDEKVDKANILEFKHKENFDSESLAAFYDRVRNAPITFLEHLAERIIEYLFVFDDTRIDEIAGQYEGRMDKVTATKLAETLIRKYT
jgi:hypothetical protein